MQHKTITRNAAGRLTGQDCPCGEDHGPSVREELDITREHLADLRALALAAKAGGGTVTADEILAITLTVAW